MYLRLARLRDGNGDRAGASEDAMRALQADNLPLPLVREAVRMVAVERSKDIPASRAVASLDVGDRVWLASELDRSLHEIRIAAVPLLQPIVHDEWDAWASDERRFPARTELALKHLGTSEPAGVMWRATLLRDSRGRDVGDMDTPGGAFDYANGGCGALTGETVIRGAVRSIPPTRSGESSEDRARRSTSEPVCANAWRMAYWATGDRTMPSARDYLELARDAAF